MQNQAADIPKYGAQRIGARFLGVRRSAPLKARNFRLKFRALDEIESLGGAFHSFPYFFMDPTSEGPAGMKLPRT